jgi:hypothetical protein
MTDAVQETVDGTLRSCVEFDEDDFNVLYVDDLTVSFYEDEAHMMSHFEEIHSYVHLDFTEMSFYTEDLLPLANRVRYLATSLDVFTVLRVYFGDEGLFVALDPDESVEPVVEAIEAVHEEA